MQTRRRDLFTTIRTEGAILPPDLLQRIAENDRDLKGITPADYHLASGENLNEAITRSWNRLVGAWAGFRDAAARLTADDPGTTETRERWLLVLFQELGYGRLQTSRAVELEGKSYPVSHAWGEHVPIHLVSFRVPLDKPTPGVAGAARFSPHGLVQEFLNRSDEHLWAFVSNGHLLRILRDNSSLTRQAYVEFDLEQMMEGEVYSDFVLLWLLCHESRVEGEKPAECWLERWSQTAAEQGTRALEGLRQGVEAAIKALGRGFLAHPANAELRESLRSGALSPQDYYRELLRLVYRFLLLFVAEDRELLFDPTTDAKARERYDRHYSTRRMRRLAERRRGTRHGDLWQAFRLVAAKLGDDSGCPPLALSPLGGFLFSAEATHDLDTAELANADLLDAVRELATIQDKGVRRAVDYKNLGSEELGSVYESLLELHPELNADAAGFELNVAAGHERKTTGSYYTPSSLISVLLDSALGPVLEEAAEADEPEQAILDLKVCDPACGSGHFLVAAAHRIAKQLASVRTGDEEPAPEAVRTALRDVVGRCLYAVDVNPMAVELCKVSLWMEALDPGKPLSFLDAHIRCGNSLLGTTPELVAAGIPDDAFKPIEGDDKKVAPELRKRNKREREGQLSLDDHVLELESVLAEDVAELETAPDDSFDAVREKARRFQRLEESDEYRHAKLLADALCAAFVQEKTTDRQSITHGVLRRLADDPTKVPEAMRQGIESLASEYRLFHWQVEFPAVFRSGGRNGFDCLIGNPPWDRIQVEEKQFFASLDPEIAEAPARKRKQMIDALIDHNPEVFALFKAKRRETLAQSHLLRFSNLYPLAGQGNLASNSLFVELASILVGPHGRAGLIVPSGIATQDNQKELFASLARSRRIVSLYEFENRERLFPDVHGQFRFCLFTIAGNAGVIVRGQYAFFLHSATELHEDDRMFLMSAVDLEEFSPNTLSCPAFHGRRDAAIAKQMYDAGEIIIREKPQINAWGWQSWQMVNETHEAYELRPWEPQWQLHGLERLYEAKLIHQFDHRYATYLEGDDGWTTELVGLDQKIDPDYQVATRYCARASLWAERVESRAGERRTWAIGYRLTTNATNERTAIFCIVPVCTATVGLPLALVSQKGQSALLLLGNLNSTAFDFVARLRVTGTNLNHFIVHQLPVIPPNAYETGLAASLRSPIQNAVLELTFTARELEGFARECGYDGSPFVWSEERRYVLRAEIDAMFLHLYGIKRDDASYIMDAFPIVRRRDEKEHGEYRTKRVILEIYDELAEAAATGRPYQTRLDPPPADPRVAHPPRRDGEVGSGRTSSSSGDS